MNFKLDPIKRFALFLMVFAGVALGYNWSVDVLFHLVVTLGFGLMLYTLYTRFSTKHKNVWDTVITCLLIFLLLHYGNNLSAAIYPLIATFLAITLKFFVEWKSSPIVNPTAAALLVTAGIGALIGWELPFVSWWGASFWALPFGVSVSSLLIATWILGGLYVWRKWWIFFSFLVPHFVLYYFTFYQASGDLEALKFILTDSTIYFLVAIMLVEPKTSPFVRWKQISYGLLAFAIYNALGILGVPYFELFALIGANLFNAGLKWKPSPKLAPAA